MIFVPTTEEKVFSVSELTSSIKALLESKPEFRNVMVRGEISNFTAHSSGHMYFSIKDDGSILPCVMFRMAATTLKFQPKLGNKVIVKGNVSVYAPRGTYQLIVSQMTEDGLGDLHRKYLLLKEKLEKEGLFAADHKKPLPMFPRTIAVITSQTGAVFHDICNVIRRRFPHVKILLYQATVQGQEGTQSIVDALRLADSLGGADVIILARGGGSLEDLWCFNEEIVARAIFASKIPVVSAVGHETDYTIADFVADLRAPTPSAAAEMVVPDALAIARDLQSFAGDLVSYLQDFVGNRGQRLDEITTRLAQIIKHLIQYKIRDTDNLVGKLDSLNPSAVLKRGFSLTMLEENLVLSSAQIKKGDKIISILSKGTILSKAE